MKEEKKTGGIQHPDRISSYFRQELLPLMLVGVSGIIYNVGLTAGPYFEGQMIQRLADVIGGRKTLSDMAALAFVYLAVILIVQGMRCMKRFYVRRFANNTARNMRQVLYGNLVHLSKTALEEEGTGALMTKAVTDVDACVEGMRKFTTELFDTGIVLISYLAMLFWYDWRLTIVSCLFTAAAYVIANRMKGTVTKYSAQYREAEGRLNDATLDRVGGAVTYRIAGQEPNRNMAYEGRLREYEKSAVRANIWENTMQPVYHVISMCGVVFILYFGAKNVTGTGWTSWDLAAFTTFLSCFTKMALKSSKAAKLFNAVQKAQVSWKRVKPFLKAVQEPSEETELELDREVELEVSHLSFAYPKAPEKKLLQDVSFSVQPGEIIGVTGPVAGGKSTFGKVFLCEHPYEGSIRIGGRELRELTEYERSRLISYQGHQPELMSDTLERNICYGETNNIQPYLALAALEQEIREMPDGIHTYVGNGGVQLSGGQQDRVAFARTLYHGRQLLILDDPFSAVDQKTEREIMEKLRKLAEHRIVLLISHRLTLFPTLSRVFWIADGALQEGTHQELLEKNAEYRKLYQAQTGGDRNAQ